MDWRVARFIISHKVDNAHRIAGVLVLLPILLFIFYSYVNYYFVMSLHNVGQLHFVLFNYIDHHYFILFSFMGLHLYILFYNVVYHRLILCTYIYIL